MNPLASASSQLENNRIQARFDDRGLVALYDKQLDQTLTFASEHWAFRIDGHPVQSASLMPKEQVADASGMRYAFQTEDLDIQVFYELKPGWRFLTKQLRIQNRKKDRYTVEQVDVFQGQLEQKPGEIYLADMGEGYSRARNLGDYAAFARMNDRWGAMFLLQNPYLAWQFDEGKISMAYRPEMEWATADGPFVSDRACIGFYALSGTTAPADVSQHEKWLLEPAWLRSSRRIDQGEVDAVVECVRQFLLFHPTRSEIIHVPWCENDYQIDIVTETGEAQFKRIVDSAAALGVRHMLYTVRNSDIADMEDAADNWHWEHLLWLNQGIQIRRNQWDPATDTLPDRTRAMQAYAENRGIQLMAYVYPSLPFEQDRSWLSRKSPHRETLTANLGYRSFQDWFIENLVVFKERTGISGYAFDYWFLNAEGLSPYAQWHGTRRVLEELRRRAPDIVIDGRQSYHGWGPWT